MSKSTKKKELNFALVLMMQRNCMRVVKILIEKGANVNVRDERKKTVLHYATKFLDLKTIRFLIKKGVHVNAICGDGHVPMYYAITSEHRFEPCVGSIRKEQLKAVELLVENGADVNATDKIGRTILFWCRSSMVYASEETREFLKSKGAKE